MVALLNYVEKKALHHCGNYCTMHLEDNSCLVQYSKEWHSKMKAGTLLKCDQNSLGELLAR